MYHKTNRTTTVRLTAMPKHAISIEEFAIADATNFNKDVRESVISLQQESLLDQSMPPLYQSILDAIDDQNSTHASTRCLPSFLVIGTQKGGTSSINAWFKLAQRLRPDSVHRWISVPRWEKELNVYSERMPFLLAYRSMSQAGDEVPYKPGWVPNTVETVEDLMLWTQSQFVGGGSENQTQLSPFRLGECQHAEDLRGEVSPNYLANPLAPLLLHRFRPDTQIVVLLRNPFERALSAFNMKWQIRVCGQLAWRHPDCFMQVAKTPEGHMNITRLYDMAVDFVDAFHDEMTAELAELDLCLETMREPSPLDTTYSLLVESSVRCLIPAPLSPTSMLSMPAITELHMAYEDRGFLIRSMYFEQLALWLHFFPDTSKWRILLASDFEDHPWDHVRQLFKFFGLDSSQVPDVPQGTDMTRHVRTYILDQIFTTDFLSLFEDAPDPEAAMPDEQHPLLLAWVKYIKIKRRICDFLNVRTKYLDALLEKHFSRQVDVNTFRSSFSCQ